MNFNRLRTFVSVARAGSFIGASRQLGLPSSTVSQHVKHLEEELRIRLIRRNTRSLVLTNQGRAIYEKAAPLFRALEDAVRTAKPSRGRHQGRIKISAPADFDPLPIALAIKRFRAHSPDVAFDIRLTNETLNLIDEDIDIALGVAKRSDGARVEKKFLEIGWRFCAAPSLLETGPPIKDISDIETFISPAPELRRILEKEVLSGRSLPEASLVCNDLRMVRSLAIQGLGIAILPFGLIREDARAGHMKPILEDLALRPLSMPASFSSRHDITDMLREFHRELQHALETT